MASVKLFVKLHVRLIKSGRVVAKIESISPIELVLKIFFYHMPRPKIDTLR